MHSDRNLLIAGAGLTVAVGLTAALFMWPNYKAAAAAHHEASELRSKMALLEGQAHALKQLNADVARSQDYIDTQLKTIPEAPDVASVIRKLSQEVDRVTVIDQTFTAGTPCDAIAGQSPASDAPGAKAANTAAAKSGGTPKDESSMQAMPLNVDMEASFDSLFALIRSAESLNRLVRIISVRAALSTTKQEAVPGAPPLLKAAVGLEAIYHPNQGLGLRDQGFGATPQTPNQPARMTSAEGS
jgi:Tfp pilus assembly protein PilO